ncbi:MAG: (2Fe-2S)-binding protein [Actinomycetota bacterium]
MIRVSPTVNGVAHEAEVEAHLTLLEFLREALHLTGAKEGCGVGECGTCLVLVDGAAVNSCLMLVGDACGRAVETIEGLGGEGLDRVQAAFVATGALQCGFCTPAMVLAATALLRANPHPTPDEAAAALAGVLCRCGTYPRVLRAVQAAAAPEETGL